MSLDTQKLDSNQRQQIMASVQQQVALQNAQELLQVKFIKNEKLIFIRVYLRNYLINVSKLVFKNLVVLYLVQNRFEYLIIRNLIILCFFRNVYLNVLIVIWMHGILFHELMLKESNVNKIVIDFSTFCFE
jgi:hypothetical protein